MIAVVTGCAGFIGSHLSEALIDSGHAVRGVDCLLKSYEVESRARTLSQLSRSSHFEFRSDDLAAADLDELVEGADVVFHLAARAGVRTSWSGFDSYLSANMLATQRLFDAVARSSSARVVYASSSSVYGRAQSFPTRETDALHPISPYGVTKLATEHLARTYASEFGVDSVGLRYFTVYGPRQRPDMAFHIWIRAALREEPIVLYGDGTAIRDFTYVNDVVNATISAAQSDTPPIMNVAGGSPVSLSSVLELIAEYTGRELRIVHEEVPAGDPAQTGGDTRRIQGACSWAPSYDLEDGLRAEVEWLSEHLSEHEGERLHGEDDA